MPSIHGLIALSPGGFQFVFCGMTLFMYIVATGWPDTGTCYEDYKTQALPSVLDEAIAVVPKGAVVLAHDQGKKSTLPSVLVDSARMVQK